MWSRAALALWQTPATLSPCFKHWPNKAPMNSQQSPRDRHQKFEVVSTRKHNRNSTKLPTHLKWLGVLKQKKLGHPVTLCSAMDFDFKKTCFSKGYFFARTPGAYRKFNPEISWSTSVYVSDKPWWDGCRKDGKSCLRMDVWCVKNLPSWPQPIDNKKSQDPNPISQIRKNNHG